jgi:FixJ family two-component response regulator
MHSETTVFVVDDDEAVRQSLSMLVETVGLNVETYSGGQEFLNEYDPEKAGCLVLDVRMPGISGLELQAKLAEQRCSPPVIIITGHGDVPMAVKAIKAGAIGFIEKPFRDQELLDKIQEAIDIDARQRCELARRAKTEDKLKRLTPRERQVMEHLIVGKPNKKIAAELQISQKTVDFHRTNIFEKMGVNSTVELVRMIQ